ncbi:MAG TPA: penicillin-binding protein 2, partial [Thermoleophilia bacterium]|nr:penicillin-binding protein 2 [Thermoleophilia bacterium]
IRLLRIAVVVAFVAIGGKAIALTSSSSNLVAIASQQQLREIALPAPRGAILDRNGAELAVGKEQRTVYATPYMLSDPERAARRLAAVLRVKRRPLLKSLSDRESGFAYVARKADPHRADKALALDLPGVGAYPEEKRVYPMRTVATQVVGVAGVDNRGLEGIEYLYDKALSGQAGSEVVVRDPAGRDLKIVKASEPRPGVPVRLTIDQAIQFTAEQVLATVVRQYRARGATAIVENPQTGEIYAMANVPLVDGNRFAGASPDDLRNKAVTTIYEPGSTFKSVAVAGCLEEGMVRPSTRFLIPSSLRVADRVINEAHTHPTQWFTVRRILAESSNVGAVKLGQRLGPERLLEWIKAFGFGRGTDLGFPGEVRGAVPPLRRWSGSTIGNLPIGQGIAVTPVQMAAAYSTLANEGVWVQPRLVLQVGAEKTPPPQTRRVISARTARQIAAMLSDAVSVGTGTNARIPGYVVAGKTGTAQKAIPGGYSKTRYVASFVGFVPARKPQLVVLVVVDEPSVHYGGVVAAPAFEKIASFALQHLEIAP